ncbi:coagulation factor IX-like [Rhynchophorus ferrugineus]|uniref:Peptidase S1 domain-containing protein n=1 Tax=Rhynchophorus ferrugineus TaxID=354439 RepID=A0A834M7U7_RHYFE|nr:hypothetical protein GWI33_018595 [Rhynchophorus ferrugineus]
MDSQQAFGLLLLVIISQLKETVGSPIKACGVWNTIDEQFPWAVGIYSGDSENKLELVCQGTVILDNIVATSAHCVCGLLDNKVKSNLYVSNQIKNQLQSGSTSIKIQPSEVFCHKEYKGFLFYPYADIAIIKTTKLVFGDSKPTPVCVDWSDLNVPSIQEVKNGLLPIWSTNMKIFKALSLDSDTCTAFTSDDFLYVLDNDKLCLKTDFVPNDSVNIGSGLIIKNPKDGLYYLEGILSYVDSDSNRKGKSTPIGATSIRQYINWLSHTCVRE